MTIWRLCIYCVLLGFITPAWCESGFPLLLTDKNFLRDRTWKNDAGLEAAIASWPRFDGPKKFEDRSILRAADVTILGTKFTSESRVFTVNGTTEIVAFTNVFTPEFCSKFLGWMKARLGDPQTTVDLSQDVVGNWTAIKAEWTIFRTRVSLACYGGFVQTGQPLSIIAMLEYHDKDHSPALEPLVYIECSGKKWFVGSVATPGDQPTEASPWIFVIDKNERKLMRRNGTPFNTTRFTDSEILVSEKTKNEMPLTIKLDRITGGYLIQTRTQTDANTGIDERGKCTPLSSKPKF